jgi:hypothetical protein
MANYFNWDVETSTITVDGGPVTPVYAGDAARSTTTANSPTNSLFMGPDGGSSDEPNGVSAANSPDLLVTYPAPPLNSASLYYRWWMRINSGFSWGSGPKQKVKINRVGIPIGSGAPGNALIYTGYMNVDGFDLSEGYWAGTDSAIQSGGDHFARVNPASWSSYADSQWHEYIWRVKPNTTATSYDGEFEVYIDGVSQGSYNAFKLVSNGTESGAPGNWVNNYGFYNMQERWGGIFLCAYWQMDDAAAGGIVYSDDFSTDSVWNSTTYPDPDGGGGGGGDGLALHESDYSILQPQTNPLLVSRW